MHWKTDDLFVLPELEDLEASFREDYGFDTDVFAIPSDNPHLDVMMRIGTLIKEHESEDTLFIVYYGGHAKIDESRQSTWVALVATFRPQKFVEHHTPTDTKHTGRDTPGPRHCSKSGEMRYLVKRCPLISQRWSAIQTLLERSKSDVLILLDCCAGAASATFPNGKSITETISASSWDAIAPDPGRYSFTNALIEVLGEWRFKTFSAAMLHAEVLARLKHPRPILINGKRFEARATPVHFMMTSDHRAPSIEMTRLLLGDRCPPSPPRDPSPFNEPVLGRGPSVDECYTEPNEDKPHVMISLALEDNQRLDLNAWEQWLASFPALAKYVKVQGVFKSHSTLLLLSMPVTLWDLLPDDQACSFVAFIRSNNLVRKPDHAEAPVQAQVETVQSDGASIFSGTTFRDSILATEFMGQQQNQASSQNTMAPWGVGATASSGKGRAQAPGLIHTSSDASQRPSLPSSRSVTSMRTVPLPLPSKGVAREEAIVRQPLINQSRNSKRTVFSDDLRVPEGPRLASHVVSRLETYFAADPNPSDGTTEYYASHLGIEATDVKVRMFAPRI